MSEKEAYKLATDYVMEKVGDLISVDIPAFSEGIWHMYAIVSYLNGDWFVVGEVFVDDNTKEIHFEKRKDIPRRNQIPT